MFMVDKWGYPQKRHKKDVIWRTNLIKNRSKNVFNGQIGAKQRKTPLLSYLADKFDAFGGLAEPKNRYKPWKQWICRGFYLTDKFDYLQIWMDLKDFGQLI